MKEMFKSFLIGTFMFWVWGAFVGWNLTWFTNIPHVTADTRYGVFAIWAVCCIVAWLFRLANRV